MQNEYHQLQERFKKFNEWENQQKSKYNREEYLHQFLILFDLAAHLPEETVQQAQQAHLNNLIEMQKRLIIKK